MTFFVQFFAAAVTFLFPALTIDRGTHTDHVKNCHMNTEPQLQEMNGQILLLENKKFVYCLSFIGLYYIAFIGFLTHLVLQSGGFR